MDARNLRVYFLLVSFFVNIAFFQYVAIAGVCLAFLWLSIFISKVSSDKSFFNEIKYSKLALAFIFSSLLTTLIRFHDNFLWNLLMIYYHFLCLFVLYGRFGEKDIKKIKIETFKIFKFFLYVPTLFSILGITIALIFNNIKILGQELGMFKGRLIGIYSNSNILAFSSTLSIISSFMIYKYKKDGFKNFSFDKIFIFFSFFVNFISVILSDSRASLLFIIIYFVSSQFCLLIKKNKSSKLKFVLFLIVSLLTVCVVFGVKDLVQNLFKQAIGMFHKKDFVEVGRGNFEITSGRNDLFIQGVKLFCHFPILGTGIANIEDYTLKFLNDDLLYKDFHNGYLTVLVSWGTIGFVIVMSFLTLVALYILKILFKPSGKIRVTEYCDFFSLLVAYSAYSFFEISLFSLIDFRCIFFWMLLGWTVCYAKCIERVLE